MKLRILYDGDCPICRRNKAFLERRDTRHELSFSNLRAPDFIPPKRAIPREALARRIHVEMEDGTLLAGMEAVRTTCRTVGLRWLAAPTGWPLLRPLFDHLYACVARHRGQLGRFFK